MMRAGGKSVDGERISAMTDMKDWLPAKAKAMFRRAFTVSMNVGWPMRVIEAENPGGALGPLMPRAIMTMRTEATMEIVHIQLKSAAKVSFRGRQSSQQAMWGKAMKATVQSAWPDIELRAMDLGCQLD